ncbi:MAG: hypothetical protein ACRYG5_16705 [Janthinobacterium lividum]
MINPVAGSRPTDTALSIHAAENMPTAPASQTAPSVPKQSSQVTVNGMPVAPQPTHMPPATHPSTDDAHRSNEAALHETDVVAVPAAPRHVSFADQHGPEDDPIANAHYPGARPTSIPGLPGRGRLIVGRRVQGYEPNSTTSARTQHSTVSSTTSTARQLQPQVDGAPAPAGRGLARRNALSLDHGVAAGIRNQMGETSVNSGVSAPRTARDGESLAPRRTSEPS